jgi:hypothetical protein
MSLGSKDSSEAPSVAAGDEEKGLFEQLRERQQEHQAEGFFARKIRAFKAYLKKCDRVVGEKLPEIADKIIEYSSDYEALRQEYPNSTLITEKGASVALQAVTGIGLGKAILQEAGMDVVNFAIGDAVGEQFEKVVNFGASKLKEKYPHLSEEQSKALVGMSVLAGFVAKDGAAAFHNLSNMLAPKRGFAVAGIGHLETPSNTIPDLSILEKKAYPDSVGKVNNRRPVNGDLAGRKFPIEKLPPELRAKYPNSVEFDSKGFPRFEPYTHVDASGRAYRVELDKITGDHYTDTKLANKAMGVKEEPDGFTWHHVEDAKTMILIPTDLHDAVRHTGGRAVNISKEIK